MTTESNIRAEHDPDGSIFLFEKLSHSEFLREQFAMLLGRGAYRGMEIDDLEDTLRELKLRRTLTEHTTVTPTDIKEFSDTIEP